MRALIRIAGDAKDRQQSFVQPDLVSAIHYESGQVYVFTVGGPPGGLKVDIGLFNEPGLLVEALENSPMIGNLGGPVRKKKGEK